MSDARGASDLMINFLAIVVEEREWGMGNGEWGMGSGDFPSPLPIPHSLLLCFSQFDDRRVLDVSERAAVFAEQPQIDHGQFVAAALIKIDHAPAQRQPFAVARNRIMTRVARCVNPGAERD